MVTLIVIILSKFTLSCCINEFVIHMNDFVSVINRYKGKKVDTMNNISNISNPNVL